MSTKRTKIIGGASALAAALMLTVAAFGQHGGPHRGGPRHGGPGAHGGPGGHGGPLGHFTRELNLTDVQKAQVKQLADSFHESTKALHQQLDGAGGGPLEGLKDGAFDEAAVRAAAQARANLHVELEVAHAKFMSQVYSLLSAEQKAKLAEHRQKFEEHRRKRQHPPAGAGEGPSGAL